MPKQQPLEQQKQQTPMQSLLKPQERKLQKQQTPMQ
jgi:hypothetical protein